MKSAVKQILPETVLVRVRQMRASARAKRDARRSPEEVFAEIYASNTWGGPRGRIWSGSGSHDPAVVDPYVAAIRARISELHPSPGATVVDLGCGDFAVGSQLYREGDAFLGCDLVAQVIESNQRAFSHLDVEFQTINIIDDPLPDGDVAFVRQVLQHLSNQQISAVLPKLRRYGTVFITEHYPSREDFTSANLDKAHGGGTRVIQGSGVYLEESPFNLPSDELHLLIEVPAPPLADGQHPGWIRTYEFTPKAD